MKPRGSFFLRRWGGTQTVQGLNARGVSAYITPEERSGNSELSLFLLQLDGSVTTDALAHVMVQGILNT